MKTTEQNQKVNNKVFVMKEMDTKFQALLPKRVDGIFKGAVKVEWHKWDDGFRRMSGPDQEIDRIPAEKCPEALRQSDERYYLNRIKTFLAARPIYDKDGMPVSIEYVTYDVVYNYETEKKISFQYDTHRYGAVNSRTLDVSCFGREGWRQTGERNQSYQIRSIDKRFARSANIAEYKRSF